MTKFCRIADLIHFMMNEAEKLMKGSVHEDDFFIVQRCFGVNESKGKNQPNKTKRGTYIDGRFP